MARGFNTTDGSATTDVLTTTYAALAQLQSWSIWAWITGAGGGNAARFFDKDNGTAAGRYFRYADLATLIVFTVGGSGGAGEWTIAVPTLNTWHHYLITYDSGNVANAPVIYVDGVSVTVTLSSAPVGIGTSGAEVYTIGNRFDGIRAWNGRLAEFAVWEGVLLSAANALSLAKGDDATSLANQPVNYWKICGVASPEPNTIGAGSGNAIVTGTLIQPHATANCRPNGSGRVSELAALGWNVSLGKRFA